MRFWLPTLAYLALTVYVIVDIAQRDEPEPYRLPKGIWILIVLLAPFVGAIAWLVARFVNGGGEGRAPRRPLGPDDDPEYRVWLNEQERRRKREGGNSL